MVNVDDKDRVRPTSEPLEKYRCGLCGLEWDADGHGDFCPLDELETVLLPEGWFCN